MGTRDVRLRGVAEHDHLRRPAMTRRTGDNEQEPPGGRAAERLRRFRESREPTAKVAYSCIAQVSVSRFASVTACVWGEAGSLSTVTITMSTLS